MKKTIISTRIMAAILSAVTAFSAAAMSVSAKENDQTDTCIPTTDHSGLTTAWQEYMYPFIYDVSEELGFTKITLRRPIFIDYSLEDFLEENVSDNMIIDLNGCSIIGLKWNSMIDMSRHTNLLIENGTIRNFESIVNYEQTGQEIKKLTFSRVTIEQCDDTAIRFSGDRNNTLFMKGCEISEIKQNSAIVINGQPTVAFADCKFKNNHGKNGGAIYVSEIYDRCKIEGCQFINNEASENGGAAVAPSSFDRCSFIGNKAGENGGAVYFPEQDWSLNEVKCLQNSASGCGGAVYSEESSTGNIVNSEFRENTAGGDGGAIYFGAASFGDNRLENVTITDNRTDGNGGGIFCPTEFCKAADVDLSGKVIINHNMTSSSVASNVYLVNDWGKKSLLYTKNGFDRTNSDISISSSSKSDIAVVDLNEKSDESAFSSDLNRRIYRGKLHNKTLYLDDMAAS